MTDELSKVELTRIDRIIGTIGIQKFKDTLWHKVHQSFNTTFGATQVEYNFNETKPDPLALEYLYNRVFILSDKTQERLIGDLRWSILEGMKNTESIDEIKRRIDKVFVGNDVNTERIARTEVLNAMAEGRQQAHLNGGIAKYKMWKAAMNNSRTAADSKRLNGQIQKITDVFVDPKTKLECMHSPNRPFCRCSILYMAELPPHITKDGLMYATSEVKKFEIDISSLQKDEKRIWIKATSKRKGHYRKIKGTVSHKNKLEDGIHNIDIITKNDSAVEKVLKDGEWSLTKSMFFKSISRCSTALIHTENDKIYAMCKLIPNKNMVKIGLLEVNPDMHRKGYGVKAMKNIVSTIIDSKIYDKIILTSINPDSDKFYMAIGMKKIEHDKYTQSEYIGDKKWMKVFMKSI